MRSWLTWVLVVALGASCGSVGKQSAKDGGGTESDAKASDGAGDRVDGAAGAGGVGGAGGATPDAGMADVVDAADVPGAGDAADAADGAVTPPDAADGPSGPDAASCVGQGATCATNAHGTCRPGHVVCGVDGPRCADGDAVADGTACAAGLCVAGQCLGQVTVVSDADLSKSPLTPGRSCAEAPQFAVTSLSASRATLAEAPVGDCLVAGDEVLLLDAQGGPADNVNVGNWELLTVASVNAKAVTFTADHVRAYGTPFPSPSADGGAGGAGGVAADAFQRLLLARVPHFGTLTVGADATLTAAPWDGVLGGLVVLRASTLEVNGTISAALLGYRSGRWSQDASHCQDNVTTEAGESIAGVGTSTVGHNFGASGGIAAATAISFNSNTPVSASPAHAHDGEAGLNSNGRTLGEPGKAYGVPDGTRLTMGSGPGGNLTCDTSTSVPHLIGYDAHAGGIVALFANKLTVGAKGAITSTPPDQPRDISFAGGYVFVRGDVLDLGAARVTAQGSTSIPGLPASFSGVNHGSEGYVVLEVSGAVSGTTAPAAHVTVTH